MLRPHKKYMLKTSAGFEWILLSFLPHIHYLIGVPRDFTSIPRSSFQIKGQVSGMILSFKSWP